MREWQDFESQLRDAVRNGEAPTEAPTTARSLQPTRIDGNNVNLDQETLSHIDTTMRYQLTLRALDGKYSLLREAIKDSGQIGVAKFVLRELTSLFVALFALIYLWQLRAIVAGPEAANNASAAGVLAPLLTLGLPTSATAAILLAAFQRYGLNPGPTLFQRNPDLVWGLIASLYIGNVMLLVLNLPLVGLFVSVLRERLPQLAPLLDDPTVLPPRAFTENRRWRDTRFLPFPDEHPRPAAELGEGLGQGIPDRLAVAGAQAEEVGVRDRRLQSGQALHRRQLQDHAPQLVEMQVEGHQFVAVDVIFDPGDLRFESGDHPLHLSSIVHAFAFGTGSRDRRAALSGWRQCGGLRRENQAKTLHCRPAIFLPAADGGAVCPWPFGRDPGQARRPFGQGPSVKHPFRYEPLVCAI